MPTLVENNKTNKPIRPKLYERIPFCIVTLIKLTNLQISHKGKTNTHSELRTVFVY